MEKTLSKFENGRYINVFADFFNGEEKKSLSDVFGYLKRRMTVKIEPLTEFEREHVHPQLKPNWELINSEYNKETTIKSTWIGHSTCLVQMEGYTFITDPVWSKRCTPLPNFPIGPARYTEPACEIKDLPKLDFVLISHAHYDHLDYNTVCEISKLQPNCQFFVPGGLKQWFINAGITKVFEFDWWEEHTFNNNNNDTTTGDLKLVYTPANHSSQRGLFDRNKMLWGSWCVLGKNQRFYFSGDTADHDKLFKQIGHFYGPFDFSLIAIGAYDLHREFMRSNHISVDEAVGIHKDIKSKHSFGIHWGTFILTCEPLLEPPRLLIEESKKNGLKENEFTAGRIGETLIINEHYQNNQDRFLLKNKD